MISFFGEQCLKDAVIARIKEHQRLDQIIHGIYWDGARGCKIGCVLHSNDHMAYETLLGLPVFLAFMGEHIFESLPLHEAKAWPLRCMEAVPVGVDLDLLFPRFMHWVLRDPHGMRQYANLNTLVIIDSLVVIYARRIEGVPFDTGTAAWAAAEAAEAAWAAAGAAAWAATEAAEAAWAAAGAATRAARAAAWAAAEAAGAAKESVIHRQADYLIGLLHGYESSPVIIEQPCEERYPWLRRHEADHASTE